MFKKILCLFSIISFLFPGLCYGHPHGDPHDDNLAIGIAIGAVVVLTIVLLTVHHPPRPLPPPRRPVGFDQIEKNSTKFKLVLTPTYVGMRLEF